MKFTTVAAALFLASAACVSPETHRRVIGEKDALTAMQAEMQRSLEKLAVENDRLRAEVADLSRRALSTAEIEEQRKKLAKLIEEKNAGLGSLAGNVEVVDTPEGLAYRMASSVLFAPGRNDLSEQGKKTLAGLLKEIGDKSIRVEGHTDDTPIVHSSWGTNMRLGVERAMVVRDFLIESGLKKEHVYVASYGEYRPAQAGSDEAARQKNRRVELLLLK